MPRRKICVVTGSRADYGLLYWLMRDLRSDTAFQLQVAVTGMHLAREFGSTYKLIEADGFKLAAKVATLRDGDDSAVGVAKAIARGVGGFADALHKLKPDLLLVLGDRFEVFAAAQAALVAKIPIAHIAGGDTTEGAYDESLRHAITKMAHLHFVTNADAARRVRQLGENPRHIFLVGSPGLDYIRRVKLLGRDRLQREIGFHFRARNLLVTFHPATLAFRSSTAQLRELLDTLHRLGDEVGLIFTYANADNGGRALNRMIDGFVSGHVNARAFASLGQERYLSAMSEVDAVVGNSSSGLYEAPSFGKPSVNIGERQKGRLMAASVINCAADAEAIVRAIRRAFSMDCSRTVNPYGDGKSSARIVAVLRHYAKGGLPLQKHFFDLRAPIGPAR